MPDYDYKEVYFHEYCKTCKYAGLPEIDDPCNECLTFPMNLYSHKPVYWKENDGPTKRTSKRSLLGKKR